MFQLGVWPIQFSVCAPLYPYPCPHDREGDNHGNLGSHVLRKLETVSVFVLDLHYLRPLHE